MSNTRKRGSGSSPAGGGTDIEDVLRRVQLRRKDTAGVSRISAVGSQQLEHQAEVRRPRQRRDHRPARLRRAGQRQLRADQAGADEPGLARDRSDDWVVDFSGDGLPEIAIGRLSVRTPQRRGMDERRAARRGPQRRHTDFETTSNALSALVSSGLSGADRVSRHARRSTACAPASISGRGGPSPTWGRHWLSCSMSGDYRPA